MFRVDAHHHLWRYNTTEYGWLQEDLSALRRDILPQELLSAMRTAGVSGTVAVQARQTVEETDWLLDLAAVHPFLLGVVGWLPLRDPGFPALLQRYREHRQLKGLRHVVQGEAPGFLDDEAFNAGIRSLQGTQLVYDILIFERQLEEVTRFVDRHPDQVFVLDHIAKPRIGWGQLQPWAERIRELARRPNIFCKVSGMITEADPKTWSIQQLQPYFDTVLEAFTPVRLIAGSDWPVLCAGSSYQQWWAVLSEWVSPLSAEEQANVLGRTAIEVYGLQEVALTGHPPTGASA